MEKIILEIWQHSTVVAVVEALEQEAIKEARHYATVYGQDGSVICYQYFPLTDTRELFDLNSHKEVTMIPKFERLRSSRAGFPKNDFVELRAEFSNGRKHVVLVSSQSTPMEIARALEILARRIVG